MKYIDADRLKAEIDKLIGSLKRNSHPDPFGMYDETLEDAEIGTLVLVKSIIDKQIQEDPKSA